jgi:hypothetical protein
VDFVVIPHAVDTEGCTLWVGAFQCEQRPMDMELRIMPAGVAMPLPAERWEFLYPPDLLPAGTSMYFRQTVKCHGLESDRSYTVHLVQAEKVLAQAIVRPLPVALPRRHEAPFTVLLGSCFCQENDRLGEVAQSFSQLPLEDRPTVKILCGDQVYLDIPVHQNFPSDSIRLAEIFLRKYVQTWRESDAAGVRGLGGLLKEGANYFTADDHEFWNNYPNAATLIQNSWTDTGRMQWRGPARHLYRHFQFPQPDLAGEPQAFRVPPASFLILDTRFNREEGDTAFLPASHMARLRQWVEELNQRRWVGFLCLGQLIFEEAAGWLKGRVVDRNLPDYAQYAELVRGLAACRQPLVILTGDVHYGRVARCRQPHGGELYEVISSPMSLVDRKVGGSASPPPATYPASAIPGLPRADIAVVLDIDGKPALPAVEHFLTMNLWSMGPSVHMQMKYWPVRTRGQRPTPIQTAVIDLVPNP